MDNKNVQIPGRLESVAVEGIVTGAKDIYDDEIEKTQAEVNAVSAYLGEDDGEAVIPDISPVTDVLWKKPQVLTNAQKEDVISNILDKTYIEGTNNGLGRKHLKMNKVGSKNILTQNMMSKDNTIYYIQYDYDLNGQTITVPENCVLEFDGGSLSNGTLVGNDTFIYYDSPFLNNIILEGRYLSDNVTVDTEIFIDSVFDTNRIKSIFCIYNPLNKIVFSNNTYNNITAIELSRDIDIDFGGSVFNMAIETGSVNYGLPSSFIVMEYKQRDAPNIDFVKIKNAKIIGNPLCVYTGSIPFYGVGTYRRCIQLFNIDNIEIDNIEISNFNSGTLGNTASQIIDRWERPIVSLWHYITAKVSNVTIHDSHADNLIGAVPKVNDNNMLELSYCYGYNIYTGLAIIFDGRCNIHDNIVIGTTSSSFNIFCYDSEVYNNRFINTLGLGIDNNEFGIYYSRNLKIYNNYFNNCASSNIIICGKNIHVYDNIIKSTTTKPAIWIFAIRNITQQPLANVNNPLIEEKTGYYYIERNIIESCSGGGIVSYMVDTIQGYETENVFINDNIIDSVCLDTSTTYRYAQPIGFAIVKNVTIKNNIIKGFGRESVSGSKMCIINIGQNNSVKDIGTLIIENNHIVNPRQILIDDTYYGYYLLCIPAGSSKYKNINVHLNKNIFDNDIKFGDINDNITLYSSSNIGIIELENLKNVEDLYPRVKVIYEEGYVCFDNNISRLVIASRKNNAVISARILMNSGRFFDNNLIEGDIYNVRWDNASVGIVYFSPTDNPNDENMVRVWQANIKQTAAFEALNNTEYPYIYIVNNTNSARNVKIETFYPSWIEQDGSVAGISRSGLFEDKPAASDIYVGFKYFCTDKQTVEGLTDGIEIIHKGNDVWIDALGRVIE